VLKISVQDLVDEICKNWFVEAEGGKNPKKLKNGANNLINGGSCQDLTYCTHKNKRDERDDWRRCFV
jgi:hypothetical protein